MSRGQARRAQLGVPAFADLIGSLEPCQAIALGALRPDLDDQVAVVTKRKLNGSTGPDIIARTAEHVQYRVGRPALALIDIDLKGEPDRVKAEVERCGGYREVLLPLVLPALEGAASVLRASTSSGLRRRDTGEEFEGSGGFHWFVLVKDGSDIERFFQVLHDRCWLAGLGWMTVGKAGQLLERSLVDRMVYAPARLVFEGPPIVDPPLEQDQEVRRPKVLPGEMLDTRATCPDLTPSERSKLLEVRKAEKKRLRKPSRDARARFIAEQAGILASRHGISEAEAKAIVKQWCRGVLLQVELQFDDPELAGCTVGDVLAEPERFIGATLADPLEGLEYGRCRAKVMQRPDRSLWIHSFAHGRTVYQLIGHSQSVETKGDAGGEGGPPNPSDLWRDGLIRGERGQPLSNFANCLVGLRGAPQLQNLFAFDEMELAAVVTRPSVLEERGVFPQRVTDDTVAGVWEWLQRNGLPNAAIDTVHRAVDKVCMDRPFHPIRD